MKKTNLIILILIIAGLGTTALWNLKDEDDLRIETSSGIKADYICNGNKTISAVFHKGESKQIRPGEMPQPAGSVDVSLSEGLHLTLPQTISADGGRYANADESFVFWSKGNSALVLENNTEKNYIGCIVLTPDPGGLPKAYQNGSLLFSLRYPEDYSVNPDYEYQEFGPGKDIFGVKFTIPQSAATGTNLSSYDTGVSFESIPATQNCDAKLFLSESVQSKIISDNGRDYSYALFVGAAAGNRYEEYVWALSGTNPCLAIRYLIHYGAIQNYPPGIIHEFDKQALLNQFDKIRDTFIVQ